MNAVVSGLLTNYADEGNPQAPAVLLLHGWGSNLKTFDGLAASLAPAYRVLRLDLPGFGATGAPGAPWHVQDYAGFVAEFLKKLDITRLHAVIGHSFGGRVIIRGLADHTFSAAQVVLLDSAGVVHPPAARDLAYRTAAKTGKAVLALPGLRRFAPALRRRLYAAAGAEDYINAGPLRQTFLNTIKEDLQSAAQSVTVPACLIWGADDTDTPPADGRTLASLIPGSAFHLIPGAGHYVHNDAPEQVAKLINEFLRP